MGDDCISRGRKGILGVPYPKKGQRLFSFTPVQGDEWPSSDDSDEDFKVKNCSRESDSEEDETGPRKRSGKRREGSRKSSSRRSKDAKTKSKKQRTDRKNITDGAARNGARGQEVDFASWDSLPIMIIQRVLNFVIAEDGVIPFLLRMSRVCRRWREAAQSSMLWREVDLDLSRVKLKASKRLDGLMFLLENRFSRLERLNLSNWSPLNLTTLETILQKCPTIRGLTLHGCNKLGSSCLTTIADGCVGLVSVDVTGVVLPGQCLNPNSVSHLLEARGGMLEELVLTRNALNKWPKVLDPVMKPDSMPRLRHLDLSSCEFKSRSMPELPVESLHWACPSLEVLLLSNCNLIGTKEEQHVKDASPGFPKLKQLHFPLVTRSGSLLQKQQDLIERILKGSADLRFLDIRGRTSFTLDFAENLPCAAVEYLFVGRCDQNILPLVEKWGHSLTTLEMADLTTGDGGCSAIASLLPSMGAVQSLDLTGTDVDYPCVRQILQHCKSLTELNLEKCRTMERGMKQNFKGERLKELTEKCAQGH